MWKHIYLRIKKFYRLVNTPFEGLFICKTVYIIVNNMYKNVHIPSYQRVYIFVYMYTYFVYIVNIFVNMYTKYVYMRFPFKKSC